MTEPGKSRGAPKEEPRFSTWDEALSNKQQTSSAASANGSSAVVDETLYRSAWTSAALIIPCLMTIHDGGTVCVSCIMQWLFARKPFTGWTVLHDDVLALKSSMGCMCRWYLHSCSVCLVFTVALEQRTCLFHPGAGCSAEHWPAHQANVQRSSLLIA